MRPLIIILLIGQSSGLFGQSIPTGDFFVSQSNDLFESELFHFDSDKTFSCFVFGCTYTLLGQGIYEVNNDTLTLNFERHPLQVQTESIEFTEGNSDKTIINIFAKTARSESEFGGVNCLMKGLQVGTVADSIGRAQLVFNKLTRTDTLEISFIGYTPFRIPVKATYDIMNVSVTLDRLSFYSKGDKEKFKINWTRQSSFGLQRLDDLELTYQKATIKKKKELTKWID
ncbi:MAG: hypothetical protein OEV24_21565 [Cyclobacteriaceae bacterium]|nr:hypothetical protein [Cyclobacteriaceae bacterium]